MARMTFLDDAKMLLAGYIPLTDHGFAIPAYCEVSGEDHRIPNTWYSAVSEIDGDRRAPIASFDVLDHRVDNLVPAPVPARRGDPWLDIFLWDGRPFAGTARQILDQIKPLRDEIQKLAPLSLLDLVLAASDKGAATLAKRAASFLNQQLGQEDGRHSFEESVVRPGVMLGFRRLAHRLGDVARDIDLDDHIEIVRFQTGKYDIEASCEVMELIRQDQQAQALGDLEAFASQVGLDLNLVVPGSLSRAEQAEADYVAEALPLVEQEPPAEPVIESIATQHVTPSLLGRAVRQIALEAGTGGIRIYASRWGIVVNEPAIILYEQNGEKKRSAITGNAATEYLNRHPFPGDMEVVLPWSDGDIIDQDAATDLLRSLISKVTGRQWLIKRLHVVGVIPAGASKVQRRLLRDVLVDAGASRVSLIETPVAAAIGANMPVTEPWGSMIVNVGAGITEVGVVSLRSLAYSTSSRVGTDKMDQAILSYVRLNHNLLIGEATAATMRRDFAVARPPSDGIGQTIHLKGRDLVNGVPKEIQCNQGQLAEAVSEVVGAIVEATRVALENTAPELAADIVDQGIVLAGAGALLIELDCVLRDETGLPVTVAEDPLNCAILGAARALEDPILKETLIAV